MNMSGCMIQNPYLLESNRPLVCLFLLCGSLTKGQWGCNPIQTDRGCGDSITSWHIDLAAAKTLKVGREGEACQIWGAIQYSPKNCPKNCLKLSNRSNSYFLNFSTLILKCILGQFLWQFSGLHWIAPLLLRGLQDEPHDDWDALGVGEHALHLVVHAQVVQHAAHRVLLGDIAGWLSGIWPINSADCLSPTRPATIWYYTRDRL